MLGKTPGKCEEEAAASGLARVAHLAKVVGCYSLAVHECISALQQEESEEEEDEGGAGSVSGIERIAERFRRAHSANPFVAEFLAFSPSFETQFDSWFELPDVSACPTDQLPLREAVVYCCELGQQLCGETRMRTVKVKFGA